MEIMEELLTEKPQKQENAQVTFWEDLWAKFKDFGFSLILILGAIGGITAIVGALMHACGKTLIDLSWFY